MSSFPTYSVLSPSAPKIVHFSRSHRSPFATCEYLKSPSLVLVPAAFLCQQSKTKAHARARASRVHSGGVSECGVEMLGGLLTDSQQSTVAQPGYVRACVEAMTVAVTLRYG